MIGLPFIAHSVRVSRAIGKGARVPDRISEPTSQSTYLVLLIELATR